MTKTTDGKDVNTKTATPKADQRLKIQLGTLAVILLLGLAFKYLPGDWTLSYREAEVQRVDPDSLAVESPKAFPIPPPPLAEPVDKQGWVLKQDNEAVAADPGGHASRQVAVQIDILFSHGVGLLRKRQYAQAAKALEGVLVLGPQIPDARVNLGFAYLGLKQFPQALEQFLQAIELNPQQVNAYYGAAMSYEGMGRIPEAIGAMRSFLHVGDGSGHFAAKARSALWEWEQQLAKGRGSATLSAQ